MSGSPGGRAAVIQRGGKGKALGDSIMVETDLFEHGEVKPTFINPCCFGEDFAASQGPLLDCSFLRRGWIA